MNTISCLVAREGGGLSLYFPVEGRGTLLGEAEGGPGYIFKFQKKKKKEERLTVLLRVRLKKGGRKTSTVGVQAVSREKKRGGGGKRPPRVHPGAVATNL